MQHKRSMPLQSPAQALTPPHSCAAEAGRSVTAPRRRIAIVEDEIILAWALEFALEQAGYSVTGIYPDADAALDGLLRTAVELVVMDINLGGGMDGIDAARRIQVAWGIPIIFNSAYANDLMLQRIWTEVPGALLLSKPVQVAELEAAILSLLPTVV